jgi:hypothetical protein
LRFSVLPVRSWQTVRVSFFPYTFCFDFFDGAVLILIPARGSDPLHKKGA